MLEGGRELVPKVSVEFQGTRFPFFYEIGLTSGVIAICSSCFRRPCRSCDSDAAREVLVFDDALICCTRSKCRSDGVGHVPKNFACSDMMVMSIVLMLNALQTRLHATELWKK